MVDASFPNPSQAALDEVDRILPARKNPEPERVLVSREVCSRTGEWLGVWDELRNWIVGG